MPRKTIPYDEVKTNGSGTNSFSLYGLSKLANVLHAQELAKRYPNIKSVPIHPGRVETDLLVEFMKMTSAMRLFPKAYDYVVGTLTVQQGALSQLWAATGKKEDVKSGVYYTPVGFENTVHKLAQGPKVAEELWDWQEAEFKRLGY